ncbi:MAG: Carbohydrate binding family 6 [Phycisphaerales bacterium]|nr:Carbohydrate binding family 6 [Phycisphaerales bacterium]
MARTTTTAAKMTTTAAAFDTLESRQMFSAAAPAVVGYLPDYQIDHLKTNVNAATLDKVNWAALTRVNYFSVVPDATTGALPGTTAADGTVIPAVTSSGHNLTELRQVVSQAHAHGVKVSIVVGGAGLDDSLTTIIGDADLRANFADSVRAFAADYGVDGVDLDWELQHPTVGQINDYGSLIHAVRTETAGLDLSAAVYATKLSIATDADPHGDLWTNFEWQLPTSALADLDHVGVMDYDLDYANHAEIGQAKANMDNWAGYLAANGESAGKLLFGVPFYGKAGYGWDDGQNDEQSYAKLIDSYNAGHSTAATTAGNDVSAAYAGKLGGTTRTWYFDGVDRVQAKTQYAIDHGFGGVMAWDLGQDHLAGGTGSADPYSLLAAIGRTVSANAGTTTTVPPSVPPAVPPTVPPVVSPTVPPTVPPTTPTVAKLTGTAIGTTGSWANAGNTRDKAVDGNLNTYFDAATPGTASNPVWVGLDLGSAKHVTQIKFASRSGYEWRMAGGVFQASTTADFSAGTVDLFTVGNTGPVSSTALTTANVTAAGNYRYVRYLAPAQAYGNIAELQVFGTTPAVTQAAAATNNTSLFSTTRIGSDDASELVDAAAA